MAHHGFKLRDEADVPAWLTFAPGKFGRMFPKLAPLEAPKEAFEALGAAMKEEAADINAPAGDNAAIPAGFTYLGQFVDHDITFDTTPLPEVMVDPLAIHNFRTPSLDLDCVYGNGPAAHPFLYQREDGAKLQLGATDPSPNEANVQIEAKHNDLPRGANGFALIGDPRNDENLLVAQTHVAFLKFHNAVVDHIRAGGAPKDSDFFEARRRVTWHYQWIVLHDFVGRLIEPAVLGDVLQNGRRFFTFGHDAFIPVEFSAAAYRLGHSMVRQEYNYNRVFNPSEARLAPATFNFFFRFTGLSGDGSNVPVPSNWIIDWRRFFELGLGSSTAPNKPTLNPTRKLDPFLAPELHDLRVPPGKEKRLPVLNLLRGARAGLPSGQAVAAAMKVAALAPEDVATGPDGAVAKAHGFDARTPLWYYILKEASVVHSGARLGPVGSRILAEVFVGLLEGDSRSFLAQAPEWKPTLPSATPGQFTMADLIRFLGAGEINPLGDPA